MVVVRVELWPLGNSRELQVLDQFTIWNLDAPRAGRHGYAALVAGERVAFSHRREDGALVLVRRALAAADRSRRSRGRVETIFNAGSTGE